MTEIQAEVPVRTKRMAEEEYTALAAQHGHNTLQMKLIRANAARLSDENDSIMAKMVELNTEAGTFGQS